MEFVEYMKIKKRMTKVAADESCGIACAECPLYIQNTDETSNCSSFELNNPEKAEAIIQKWAEEHPRESILQEFLKHYPNAPLNEHGAPVDICPSNIGYNINICNYVNCIDCWNQPIPEE